MKIKISGGSLWFQAHYYEIQFELNGAGTADDPFLITNNQYYNDYDLEYYIYDSSSYIKFNKILFKSLYLNRCQNIIILDAQLKNLGLNQCSKVLIQNTEIKKTARLIDSNIIKFADCNLNKLEGFSGDQILISNCTIKRISKETEASILVEHSKLNKLMKKYQKGIHGKDFAIEKS